MVFQGTFNDPIFDDIQSICYILYFLLHSLFMSSVSWTEIFSMMEEDFDVYLGLQMLLWKVKRCFLVCIAWYLINITFHLSLHWPNIALLFPYFIRCFCSAITEVPDY